MNFRRSGPPHIKVGDLVHARDPVGEYFAGKASGYRSRSARIPWAWVRTRELPAVRALLGDVAGADVLELGAGVGFYTEDLIRNGARHIWAVDMSAAMLERLPVGQVTPVLGDAAAIRLDRRFPLLLSTGMLEFVKDREAVLANAAAHAAPNARSVLLVPRRGPLGHLYRGFHRGHGFDIHLFDAAWFASAAPRCGWRVAAAVRVAPFSLAVQLSRQLCALPVAVRDAWACWLEPLRGQAHRRHDLLLFQFPGHAAVGLSPERARKGGTGRLPPIQPTEPA